MPIEAYLLPDGSDEPFHFATVEPGELGIFIDKSLKAGEYIVAHCHQTDLWGDVHTVETESEFTVSEMEAGAELEVCLTKDNLDKTINLGCDYEKDILDVDGEKGRLILQHEADLARTMSGIFYLD
jgi:hypothetical protein